MITTHQIQRYFQARHFEPLLRGVSPIGLELPMPLHLRLAVQPAAVIALALRRVLELTYGPTQLSRELVSALLHMQNDDGSFGAIEAPKPLAASWTHASHHESALAVGRGDPLATAAAIAALTALLREHASPHPEAAVARERAIAALASTQADDGLFLSSFDRTDDDRALSAAFVLALLAGDDDVRQAIRSADLMDWFDERAHRLADTTATLWRLACVDVSISAAASTREPAMAA